MVLKSLALILSLALLISSCSAKVENSNKITTDIQNNNESLSFGYQHITCEIPMIKYFLSEENILNKIDSSDISEQKIISFSLPEDFYKVDNSPESDPGITYYNGDCYIHIICFQIITNGNLIDYAKETEPEKIVSKRTFLDNCMIDSIIYPRMDYNDDNKNFSDLESNTHLHMGNIFYNNGIIKFSLTEERPLNSDYLCKETLQLIDDMSKSFS